MRFQSPTPNGRGHHPGVFALVNGLARDGRLDTADLDWWAASNARLEAAYTDPSVVDPRCYDAALNPSARAWFRSDAVHLLDLVTGHLELLDRYAVAWERVESDEPGRIVYADDVQVVVVPR